MTKSIWKSKTFWFNTFTILLTAAEAMIDMVPPEWTPVLVSAIAAINIGLRSVTKTAVAL